MGEMIVFVPQQTVYRVGGEWKYSEDGIHQADIAAADPIPEELRAGNGDRYHFAGGYKNPISQKVAEELSTAGFGRQLRREIHPETETIHRTQEAEYTANAARKEIAELREQVEQLSRTVFALEGRLKEPVKT